jgi:hypothetical protein
LVDDGFGLRERSHDILAVDKEIYLESTGVHLRALFVAIVPKIEYEGRKKDIAMHHGAGLSKRKLVVRPSKLDLLRIVLVLQLLPQPLRTTHAAAIIPTWWRRRSNKKRGGGERRYYY